MDDYTPRPKASQAVAAAKRAQRHDTEPITPLPRPARQYVPVGVGALVIIVLMIGMASYQLVHAPVRPLAPTTPATFAPSTLVAPSTALPAPSPAPEPTIVPTDPPVPTQPPAPMTGQGLTLEPEPVVPTEPTPAPPPLTAPDVQLVVTGDNDQHTTVIGLDACKVASGARRCGK